MSWHYKFQSLPSAIAEPLHAPKIKIFGHCVFCGRGNEHRFHAYYFRLLPGTISMHIRGQGIGEKGDVYQLRDQLDADSPWGFCK